VKTRLLHAVLIVAATASAGLFARRVPIATQPSDVTSAASGALMHLEYARAVGRMADITNSTVVCLLK
jgi:hypothetical protein